MSLRPADPKPARLLTLRVLWEYPQLGTALVGGVLLAWATITHLSNGDGPTRLVLVGLAYVLCGWGTAYETVRTLARLKLDIDVLMFAAAMGAAALGHYEEGALLLLLFALGGAGEDMAIGRARREIEALTRLAPRTAVRLSDDGERVVPVEELAVGDTIRIAADQQVPADAVVMQGSSSVDQSPITGESMPVDKRPGDSLFAGTFNHQSAMIARVARRAQDNTLSKVIRLVEEARHAKSRTQRFTERFARWYVPMVLGTTLVLMVLPPLLGIEPRRHDGALWAGWFYQALAFLTAASPCALAIGTPAAILAGIGRAAKLGVLIKGGVHLENLAAITAVAFDKTGTLTVGRPRLEGVRHLAAGWDADRVLQLAASVEQASPHPLAKAVVTEAQARGIALDEPRQATRAMGLGMRGQVAGKAVMVGSRTMFNGQPLPPGMDTAWEAAQREGYSTMAVAADQQVLGLLVLRDTPRPEATEAIEQLRRLGLGRLVMLTGDHAVAAEHVARQLGIDDCRAQLLPDQKLALIRELDQAKGGVAMVGDGVNDAPALAAATVGIAVGGAGSANDVALETADIVLLAADLRKLPQAIDLARFTRRIIRQNLLVAFGVIALLAPIAAMGLAPISVAVIFHEGSTVAVVLNGLRVLRRGKGISDALRRS